MKVPVDQNTLLGLLKPNVCLTISELHSYLSCDRRRVTTAMGRLLARGYIERIELGCYQLTDEGIAFKKSGQQIKSGPARKKTGVRKVGKKGNLRLRAWRAIPVLKRFTIAQVLTVAANGSEKNAYDSVQKFIKQLCHAGYLRELPIRQRGTKLTSNGNKRYSLLKHTGPDAPRARGTRKLFDPNTNEVHSW
jgi:Mn-dependent DtxR family transcriptional regulator